MTMTPARYPVAPPTIDLKGTLLDAATISGGNGIAWQDGRDLYESFNRMRFDAEANFCTPNAKDLTATSEWTQGFLLAAYGGATCNAVGMDRDNAVSEVERVFKAGESTGVERGMMKYRFREGEAFPDGPTEAAWDAPVDITPATGAVSPKTGVAMLEGFAASEYVGTPTIHVPRYIGILLLDNGGAQWDGDMIRSNLGAKVAAGVGYDYPNTGPDGTAAPDGEKWLYVTGEVLVSPGEYILRDEMNYSNNEVVFLAERPYLVAVDTGFAAAIRVKVEE